MDQVINELSVAGGYQDEYAAAAGMQQLLELSKNLSSVGFRRTIRTTRDFSSLYLAQEYSIQRWATENTNDATRREFQRYYLTVATKGPFIEELVEEFESEVELIEYRHASGISVGIGLADLLCSFVLSIGCSEQFCVDFVKVNRISITPEGESESHVDVLNLWSVGQVDRHMARLEEIVSKSVHNGADLIRESERLFPRLSICDSAREQIESLNGNEKHFPKVLRHLRVLNKTMEKHNEGAFDPAELNWSRDSESTMNQFPDCRTFECKDGVERTFSCHSKFLGANQRMYFYPIEENRVVHIGYLGKHLPTTRFRT
jgi:hypothetical protein